MSKPIELRGEEISVALRLRQDKNGDDYYVAHPLGVSLKVDLSLYVCFFFPPMEDGTEGKLLFRPAKAQVEKAENDTPPE